MSFSPDGTRIVTGSDDQTAKVWDARTGQELKGEPIPPTPRPGQISPDGRWIAHVGRQPRRTDPVATGCGGAGLSPAPHAAELPALSGRLRRGDEGQRRLRGPVLPQPLPAARADATSSRGDRRAPVCPLAAPRRRARRPQGPTGGRSGSPGSLPEAGRNLARIRSRSATTSVGLWFASPGSRTRFTSAACAWPRPPAGSSLTMALILNTLGVAQYRCGLVAEALATLTRSNDLNKEKEPADLAFLALAQQPPGSVRKGPLHPGSAARGDEEPGAGRGSGGAGLPARGRDDRARPGLPGRPVRAVINYSDSKSSSGTAGLCDVPRGAAGLGDPPAPGCAGLAASARRSRHPRSHGRSRSWRSSCVDPA